jgi:class 3 adenylate cyclase/uncharacterized protein YndB with AHSA1/START domain
MQFTRTLRIAAPREKVWDLLADTERLNRELGLPPVRYEFQPRPLGGTEMFGTVQMGPVQMRYHERPFEWVRPDFYSERRLFQSGPFQEFRARFTLAEEGGGTRVTCVTDLTPHGLAGRALTPAFGNKAMNDLVSAWERFAAYLTGQAQTPYPRHSAQVPVIRDRMERALAALRRTGAEEAAIRRLADHLEHAPPEDVMTLRPFALADAWGLDRKAVLETCLQAARQGVGLLELRWRLICPVCQGAAPENVARTLRDIASEVHCPSCNIRFDADFDQSVEVSFAVSPQIRPVQEILYCRGGPGLSPHVYAQFVLEPGETRAVPICLPPGRYALTSLQAVASVNLCVEAVSADRKERTPSAPCVRIERQAAGIALTLAETCVGNQAEWALTNRTDAEIVLRLESQEPGVPVVTAAQVTSMQTFRDAFSSEVLSPDVEVAVRQVCILFSDLKSSTAMYRERGDAPSYRAVRDHFAALRRIVADHAGAVVKTIGDSVMASFLDPADGLAAAVAIQQEARTWAEPLTVKLGLHSGPALAVNANEWLDYFGQTVNLAARLQSESVGADIVVAAELLEDARAAEVVRAHGCRLEPFTQVVRGFEEPLALLRITLPEGMLESGA